MSEDKWLCSCCTYLNWNASLKCVICGKEKAVNRALSQEIYNLNITQDRVGENYNPSLVLSQSNIIDSNKVKWPCSACTYLNWPKARKCIQCNTVRPTKRGSPTLSQTSSDDLSNKDVAVTDKKLKNDDVKASSSENMKSNIESFNLSKAFQKWICHVCTYENWPKSKVCIMCQSLPNPENNVTIDVKLPETTMPIVVSETPTRPNKKKNNNPDRLSIDMLWLEACNSVLSGNIYAFESYLLTVDSKLDRTLTIQECRVLNQPEIFKPGLTLLDLACKLGRDDFIELYLSTPPFTNNTTKQTVAVQNIYNKSPSHNIASSPISNSSQLHRMPCHISPHRAIAIQAHLCETLRMRKGDFPCYVVHEHSTFWLPAEIELLPLLSRCRLFDELLDKNVQRELEVTEKVINWWAHNTTQNRLVALWNRTAGDCLLDSVLQATWGILDRDNVLRQALADSMRESRHLFYPRWREYEGAQARAFNYTISEFQFQRDWQNLLHIACQQGEPLEQVHIFVLCHILRRPIIVYGVKYINNHRNEPVGLAHFQGVYLPLLWERPFCSRNPIVLGYTRGHFSALVPSESLLNTPNAPALTAALLSQTIRSHETPQIPTNISTHKFSSVFPCTPNLSSSTTSSTSSLQGSVVATTPHDSAHHLSQSTSNIIPHLSLPISSSACPISNVSSNKTTINPKVILSTTNTPMIQVTSSTPGINNIKSNQNTVIHGAATSNTTVPNNSIGGAISNDYHFTQHPNSVCLLPLYNCNKQLLPIHFLSDDEGCRTETLLRDWLDVVITRRGYLMARMRPTRRHPLVSAVIDDWLEEYRNYEDDDEEEEDEYEDDEEEEDEDDDDEEEEDDDEEDDEDEQEEERGQLIHTVENREIPENSIDSGGGNAGSADIDDTSFRHRSPSSS